MSNGNVLCACAAVFLIAGGANSTNAQPFIIEPIAVSGQQAPGTNAGVVFSEFSRPVLNASGQVAFDAILDGPGITSTNNRGVWAGLPSATSLAQRSGTLIPANVGVGDWLFFTQTYLTDGGSLAFRGAHSNQGMRTDGVFFSPPGSPRPLSVFVDDRNNQPLRPDGTVTSVTEQMGVSPSGRLVVQMALRGAGFNSSEDSGIWAGQPGDVQVVAQTRAALPGATPFEAAVLRAPQINAAGDVAFSAQSNQIIIVGGIPQRDAGFWRRASGVVEPVLRSGDQAPGLPTGARMSGDYSPAAGFNNAGQLAMRGVFRDNPGGTAEGSAIWLGTPGDVALIARRGEQAPGTALGVTFDEMRSDGPVLGGLGDLMFGARLAGLLVNTNNDDALFISRPVGGTTLLIREGDLAPGEAENVVFTQELEAALNGSGMVAIEAGLRQAGSTNILGNALYTLSTTGALVQIIGTGDSLTVAPGETRVVNRLSLVYGSGGQDGRPSALTDDGQLVFSANFSDGSSGIFVTTIPAPSVAAVLSGFLLVTLGRRRR